MFHTIAVVTVVYENYTILTDFFRSFENQTDRDFKLYIVDLSQNKKLIVNLPGNASLIPSDNKGYAHGVNVGTQQALKDNLEYIIVINSDTIVKENFIEKVRVSLDLNGHALIGGKIYYYPGYEYHKDRCKIQDLGNVLWYAGGKNDWANCNTVHIGVDEIDQGHYDTKKQTEFITGCFMCFKRQTYKQIGPWDESYFLYFEDADYCEQAKRKNIKLIYDPEIVIWHKNAQSTNGSGSPTHTRYQRKNQLIFGLKYAPLRTKFHLVKNYFFSV